MSKLSKKLFAIVGVFAVLGMCLSAPEVQARPKFPKVFVETYPDLKDAAKMAKCGICHEGKNKKIRNDYGKTVAKGLEKKNETDAKKIMAALKKAEEAKGSGDKTYGQMIKAGELPK